MSKKVKKVWWWRVRLLFLRTRSISDERSKLFVESKGRPKLVVVFARRFSVCMKIISWNTRGIGSKKERRIVKSFLSSQNLDIVMLLETKR